MLISDYSDYIGSGKYEVETKMLGIFESKKKAVKAMKAIGINPQKVSLASEGACETYVDEYGGYKTTYDIYKVKKDKIYPIVLTALNV